MAPGPPAAAAGSAYATHAEPMIPVYLFYSMFGFQRTGDSIWAMADQMARGFLVGATAGRTTLTGEGLQHADGHSPLLARSNPAVVHYDPAYAFEIAHIVKDGLRRMYGDTVDEHGTHGENVIYYLTVYNEPINQPTEPEDVDVEGILKGAHRYAAAPLDDKVPARILASGVAVPWALEAQKVLAEDYGVAAEVWSVTSWNELAREAEQAERWNFNHLGEDPRTPWITTKLGDGGPTIAVSDYMRAVPDQISRWVPGAWSSLGADGFGFADTRAGARRYFQIDTESIVVATLAALGREGRVAPDVAKEAFAALRIDDPTAVAGVEQEGADA